MKTNIILTEKQLDRVMKTLKEDDTSLYTTSGTVNKSQAGNRKEQSFMMTGKGSKLFKKGDFEVDPNNSEITKIISKLLLDKANSVTVSASASNTGWGSYPAGSKQAFDKNKQLAEKRRDSMINLLRSKLGDSVTITKGTANVGDKNSKNFEADQKIEVKYTTTNASGSKEFRDIGAQHGTESTSTQRPNQPQTNLGISNVQDIIKGLDNKRVCVKVPTDKVSSFKKAIYKWAYDNQVKNIPVSVNDYK